MLNALLEHIPGEGKIITRGRRALLLDLAPFEALRTELIDLVGHEQARKSFERFGYVMGHNAARHLRDRYHWDSEREWLLAGPVMLNWSGQANVSVQWLDFNRATGSFLAEITWIDSYESERHMHHFGLSTLPVCWILTGYLGGYFSLAYGQNILCLEQDCVGKGDTHCVALAKPIASWGEAARKSAHLMRFEEGRKIQRLNQQLSEQQSQINQERRAALAEALKEARFQALQNQVNPHFFFNAINVIATGTCVENRLGASSLTSECPLLMRCIIIKSISAA